MKRIAYTGPFTVTVESISPVINPPGNTLIKVAYAGICGSDMNIYHGVHPRAKAPLTMGHEFSGTVVEGHPVLKPGTPVTVYPLISCGFCESCTTGNPHVCSTLKLIGIDTDGGMAEYASVPHDKVIELPRDVSLKAGSYAEPLAVGVHAIHRSNYKPGDRTVIFGAGPIGMSVALCLREFGASSVVLIEGNPYRLSVAQGLGFGTIDPTKESIPEKLAQLTGRSDADIVFDCAAHPSVQKDILGITKIRGTMVVVGSYKKSEEVDLLKIEFKELTVVGTRVYRREDFPIAVRIIQKNQETVERLITAFSPDEASKVFADLRRGTNVIKATFAFGEGTAHA